MAHVWATSDNKKFEDLARWNVNVSFLAKSSSTMSSEGQTGSITETTFPQTGDDEKAGSLRTSGGKEKCQAKASKRKLLKTLSRKGTKSLQDLIKCSICLDRLYIPKMLPCQHTFCLLCIQNCIVGSGDAAKIRCAQCRSENSLPKEGVSVLPGNIYLQSILDLLETDYATVDDFVQCSNCQTICYANVCEHCNNSFCPVCQERHLDELKKQLSQIADQLEMMTDKLEKRMGFFQDYCMKLKEEIHEAAVKHVKKIVDTETHLLQNVDQIMSNEDVIWKESVKNLDKTVQQIRDSVNKDFNEASDSAEKKEYILNFERDTVEPSIVGGTHVPLLRIVQVKGHDGDMITEIFTDPHYRPISKQFSGY
ncbi:RING finger protein nhl-1-like [Limulus polyphemus]|uniref:RING finger protein nhl-1-like n=1 Tax=Limulus polyphemus TaxID=6850 RepID=A0ABM1SR95_LIMPO|nr:RING finger protein nhl-1-like [Limulus polyphemus]